MESSKSHEWTTCILCKAVYSSKFWLPHILSTNKKYLVEEKANPTNTLSQSVLVFHSYDIFWNISIKFMYLHMYTRSSLSFCVMISSEVCKEQSSLLITFLYRIVGMPSLWGHPWTSPNLFSPWPESEAIVVSLHAILPLSFTKLSCAPLASFSPYPISLVFPCSKQNEEGLIWIWGIITKRKTVSYPECVFTVCNCFHRVCCLLGQSWLCRTRAHHSKLDKACVTEAQQKSASIGLHPCFHRS